MYTYQWHQWLAFFYIYCFFGWIFESTYVSLKEGHFVNRGFLRLPMLPLYGTGAVMMLWVSLPVKDSLVLIYISGVVAATALEYATGWLMERLFKMKYWDYSYQRFQLNGYICLSSSIAWGFLTIFLTKIIHQPIARVVLSLRPSIELPFLAVVSAVFVIDTIQSTKEALALGKALEAMTKMKAELEEMQAQLALLKAETSQRMEDIRTDARHRVSEWKSDASVRASELRQDAVLKAAELKEGAQLKVAELKEETQLRAAEFKEETQLRATELKKETQLRVAELKEGAQLRAAELKEGAHLRTTELKEGAHLKATELKEGVHLRAAGLMAGAQLRAAGLKEEAAARITREAEEIPAAVAEKVRVLSQRRQELLQARRHLSSHMSLYMKGIIKGNPTASSKRFGEALEELREILEQKSNNTRR